MTISTRRVLSAVVLFGTVAMVATGWYVYAQSTSRPGATVPRDVDRWEYLIVSGGTLSLDGSGFGSGNKQRVFEREASSVERNLDQLGEEGWELTAVGGSANQPAYFLKRPKRR